MAKENLVASIKAKSRKPELKKRELLISEFEETGRPAFSKDYDGFSISFACSDAIRYIGDIEVPVHLVITSPPYNCDIKYDSYDDNIEWDEYEDWMIRVFSGTFGKMVEGGRVVLNFPQFVKGKEGRKSLSAIFERVLKRSGFDIADFITWVKARDEREAIGAAGRSTAWGSWMSPSSPNVRPITELIIVAKKPGKYRSVNKEITITKEEFKAYTISAWFFNGASSRYHPATFPPELAARVIKLYSYRYDNVLDPFLGIGSTAIACLQNERSFLGCDISKNYITVAADKFSIGI